ncbi:MAG: tRNA (guanosine(46)-N7)-methyltransferase TrmB [Bacteriovoracaceae bacterium]|nr:tRNA (guanosine(46)-N7)-methyltransferase TrmB [Bacteriovoracaceae bacterium]
MPLAPPLSPPQKSVLPPWNQVSDYSFREDFKYRYRANPYQEKLKSFASFVLQDHEGEQFAGRWHEVFGNGHPLVVEIGAGYGDFMAAYCTAHPQENYVALDYRFRRSLSVAQRLAKMTAGNFRYLRAKGERISYLFGPQEVQKVLIFFPDPWPKLRHHKKRLINPHYLNLLSNILGAGGEIWLKTDHDEYAAWMEEAFAQVPSLTLLWHTHDLYHEYPAHPLTACPTKFEKIFLGQGIAIKAFILRKNPCHV